MLLRAASGLAGVALTWAVAGAVAAAEGGDPERTAAGDAPADADAAVALADAGRGEVLAGVAGCLLCHGPQGGGGTVKVPGVGEAYAPPITRSAISGWSDQHWQDAFRKGRSPSGTAYGPFFPWTSLGRMTDTDLADVAAWARSLPDVVAEPPTRPKGVWTWIGPAAASAWAAPEMPPLPAVADVAVAAQLARGRYLVATVGHCGSCHDGRTWLGRPDPEAMLGGGPRALAPNITAGNPEIGALSIEQLADRLGAGEDPEGEPFVGEMAEIAEHGLARLTPADRRAIAAWLLAVPPVAASR